MPNRSSVISLSSIFLFLSLSCGSSRHTHKSKDMMPGTWQSTPIVVDGDSKDWPSPYPNFDSKAKIAYATSNDKEFLYITMETGDEMTQTKILKQGMTVSIDTGGGKQADFHINFPLPNDNDEIEIPKAEGGRKPQDGETTFSGRQIQMQISKMTKAANQFSIDGFINCNGGYMASQSAPCGIRVSAAIDEYKELVWEAVVPFKAIYNKEVITASDSDRLISVCFTIKGFKEPATKSTVDNSGTGMGGSGMGGHGGGSGRGGKGGGKGPSENPMQHLYETTRTWKHFALAYKQ